VLDRKKKCILELKAIGYEDVPNRLSEEFRRKIRIAAGNFQNLKTFYKLLWPPNTGLAFSFFSHKVLRWLGPFFLLFLLVSNTILALSDPFYRILLMIQGGLIISPFIDYLLRKIGLHIVILRFITHFYSMNLALLAGFLKFMKGTETNVWQPTRRT
jgi:cellulose synthase/poly-beta-1,6-N-acetylglucosamine synthase-like glycosyltransferase